ncbi:hypothetical protein AX16_004716 [Volvariella volvacea WC 439]|nr:hypothetical protein AX16_004716 [Volvariella volvacea WC 439]
MSSEQYKDPQRVASGLKATTHNPRVSGEAKESATSRLEQMGEDVEAPARSTGGRTSGTRGVPVQGATEEDFRNAPGLPTTQYTAGRIDPSPYSQGQSLAQQAQEYDNAEYDDQGEPQGKSRGAMSGQPGEQRVLGGYRATMSNPKVSQEAKRHAEQVLRDNDAL